MNNEDENVNSYIEKGEILLNDNKYDGALVFFNRVIECPQFELLLNSIKYETYFDKGFTLWKLNKNIEAIECYNRAIEINPTISLSYLFKSFSLANLSMYEEADLDLLRYSQLIRLQPELRTLLFPKPKFNLYSIFHYSLLLMFFLLYLCEDIFIHFKVLYFVYFVLDFFLCLYWFYIYQFNYRFYNYTSKIHHTPFLVAFLTLKPNEYFFLFMWVILFFTFNYSSFFSRFNFYFFSSFLQFDPKSVQYQSINEALKKEMNSEFMSHFQTPP